MAAVVRIYEDGAQARSAYQALRDLDFNKSLVALLVAEKTPEPAAPAAYGGGYAAPESPYAQPAEAAEAPAAGGSVSREDLSSAVEIGSVIGPGAGYYLDYVDRGYSVVAIDPPFGTAALAMRTLDAHSPLQLDDAVAETMAVEPESRAARRRATPLSSSLGLGVLTGPDFSLSGAFGVVLLSRGLSFMSRWFGELGNPHYSLSSKFGMGMLSSNAAPISSLFGVSTRSQNLKSGDEWKRSMGFRMLSTNAAPASGFFGFPLLSGRNNTSDYAPEKHRRKIRHNAAPLSGLFGLGLLSNSHSFLSGMFAPLASHDWTLSSKFGMGLLSKDPAPLSSLFNMKVLKEKSDDDGALGFPALSHNPAPLSGTFGIPVLTRK